MPRYHRRISRLLMVAATIAMVTPLSSQTLRGRVQEAGTPVPVAVVDLAILSPGGLELARTQSDSAGLFSLSWTGPAEVRLRAQRLGFETSTSAPLLVRRDEIVTVRMFMSTAPVRVEPLVVHMREKVNDIMGDFAELERRKKLGLGKFITREQIEKTGNTRISEMLQHVPGVHLRPEPGNAHSVAAYSNMNTTMAPARATNPRRRSTGMDPPANNGECPMMIFLDGRIHRYPIAGVNVLPTSQVETIEVYRTMSEVPAMFAGEHVRCGVVAIWTRKQ